MKDWDGLWGEVEIEGKCGKEYWSGWGDQQAET